MAMFCTLQDVKEWLGLESKPITGITKAANGIMTVVKHNFKTGYRLIPTGIGGMTALNGVQLTITYIDADTFYINVNTSTYAAYTSGGFVAADDNLLTNLIESASEDMQNEANRPLELMDHVENYNGYDSRILVTRNYPITEVTELTIDGVSIPAKPAGSFTNIGYTFTDRHITLSGKVFLRGLDNVSISYSAGYDPIPADLRQACVDLVSFRYRAKDRIGLISKGLAGETITYDIRHLPAQVMRVVQRYKRVIPV
jgi:hypothetical protein